MSSVTTARTDPWRCRGCGAAADLAPLSAEIGLVRLAMHGAQGFRLGSEGVEADIEPLLAACDCGGRFEPGSGQGEVASARFDTDLLQPLARSGWEAMEAAPELAQLASVWRARALRACGREHELTPQDVMELKLEQRLNDLLAQVERARRAGDEDAAETAHARYVEVATTYAMRTLGDRRPA